MTRHYGSLLTATLMALSLSSVNDGQTTAAALFQEGLMLERAEGKLREAIARYERVVNEYPDERQVVAKALLQLAGVYEQLKRPEARQTYERILRDLGDVPVVAADARARLAALPAPGPARVEGVVSKRLLSGAGADRYGSVSRDGRYLSFMDSNGDLAIRDLQTGENTRVTSNAEGSNEFAEYSIFSPDGQRLVYGWSNARGDYELRIINRDGSGLRQLYAQRGVSWLMPYDWSPDGRDILAILPRDDKTRQLILVSASDGAVRVLKTLHWNMGVPDAEFSPDGRFIAYDRASEEPKSDRDVFMLAANGSREVPLATGPGDDGFLGWFPDGKAVLFSSDRSGAAGAWMIAVDERGPVGEPRLLKPDVGRLQSKGFTRHGEFFYFKMVGGPDVYLAEIDPASGRVQRQPAPLRVRAADGRMWASWSPDGERLVYRPGTPGAGPHLALHDIKTDVVQTVPLRMSYLGRTPSWSAGGLIVAGADEHARLGIYRIDLGSGAASPLVQGVLGLDPVFSPDGNLLFYVQMAEAEQQPPSASLMARDVRTGEARKLMDDVLPAVVALSPDGRSVAVKKRMHGGTAVYVTDTATGASREVVRLDADDRGPAMAWTADGSALLIVRGKGGAELWRVPVDGAQPEQLDLKLPRMLSISVNPDNRRLAIVAAQTTPEVWVLQNLAAARDGR